MSEKRLETISGQRRIRLQHRNQGKVMSNQIEIEELTERIKNKEGQLYRAEKEMTSWSSGKYQSHSNVKMSKQFVDASRKELAELRSELKRLEREKS